MKKDIVVVRARKKWLKKKKLDNRKFAEATGNDTGTSAVWFKTGRTPRRKYLEDVLAVYPDFPLAQVEA